MCRVRCYKIASVLLCLLLVIAASSAQRCGERKVVNLLVVNGNEAKDGYWPWHVAIFHKHDRTFEYACGGTILDQNTVVTAAHCVMTSNGIIAQRRLLIQLGRNRLNVASQRAQEHEAFQVIVYPEYNVNSIRHDIALIMLATDITYTDYIQPICLWNGDEDLSILAGAWGTVIGFGMDETGNVSDTLREATIPVVSHITCIENNRDVFAKHLTADMFCAGNLDGIGACNGDSGGGLFFEYDDVWFIRGIVSFSKPRQNTNLCDTMEYIVFTDVAKYLTWIKQHARGTVVEEELVVIRNDISRKIELLPMSTCGFNRYANWEESSKPVLLGYPWMGLVECTDKESLELLRCQAVLISDRYLIATEVCIYDIQSCPLPSIRLGEYDTRTTTDCAEVDTRIVCSPPVQSLRIESVIMHPNYKRCTNNIGLIRLRDRADTSLSNVNPICLPVTSDLRSKESVHYTTTSWTRDESYNYLPMLVRQQHETVNTSEFGEIFTANGWDISIHQISVKYPNNDSCLVNLDSGSLHLVQRLLGESRYVLYGILSCGFKCDIDVYTNVASFVDWILENIEE